MATYVNDLRLKEIATGDESGTWGTSTNTNLELIAEAFSFGTEAITTNADTHTTTIADGSTDPGRSIYLKYTGTLDSACTITIGPNTVSKLWFIENGTSGSQNIIISQGSGANVTIPAGDVKAVYSDGAGSGAAIVDAFASLNVVDLKVEDDLTVTDDASVGGDLLVSGEVQTANIGFTDGDNAITISDGGGTSFAQALTANAGVVVDNITIDGQEIDVSSGDLTLDVAGDIILDAAGSDFQFNIGGTNLLNISNASLSTEILQQQSNTDIKFKGNDGGSTITALTLDMSEAGTAVFNNKVGVSNVSSPNANLHVGSDNATGDATNPAIQIGGTSTYRMGMYTSAEAAVIENKNGDDGIQFRVKTLGEAVRINGTNGFTGFGETSPDSLVHVTGTNNSAGDLYTAVGRGNVPSITIQNAGTTDNNNAAIFFDNDSTTGASIGARFNSHSNDETQLRFSTTNTSGETRERMVLFGDGKLGLNEFNPAGQLHIKGTDVSASPASTANQLILEDTENGISILSAAAGAGNIAFGDSGDNFKGGFIYDHSADAMRHLTNGSERMRIASNGQVMIARTTAVSSDIRLNMTADASVAAFGTENTGTGNNYVAIFRNSSGTLIGSIIASNSAVAFNTTSDARLKEVTGKARGLDVINKLNPVAYNWKEDGKTDEGLIAQEVLDIVPNAVTGSEEDYYQMDYSKLVTPLIKAIQEQQEQIDALQSEIQSLKGE